MNHPLDHRGYTFYQSNYIRVRDPHTGQFTGQFQSVFQVATNPGRPIIYGGCLLVVLGAFLQFYMRAGIFTDGGKRERERRHRRQEESRAEDEDRRPQPGTEEPLDRTSSLATIHEHATMRDEPPGDSNMRRIGKRLGGLILAGMWAAVLPARAADDAKSPGTGPAYELIGKVAVMHEGRVKPLDTVAREEVKQIYGRETIKLRDPNEEIEKILDPESHARKAAAGSTVEKWGPVGAFLGWTIDPEFWDDQPFILVEYLPLETADRGRNARDAAQGDRREVDDPRRREGRSAKAGGRPGADRRRRSLAFLRGSKLPLEDRKTIAEVAAKLSEEHKWLTPRELEEAKITDKDHDASRSSTGPASSRSRNGSSTPIPCRPPGSPRSSGGRSRSPCGSRPTRPIAESGFRIPA